MFWGIKTEKFKLTILQTSTLNLLFYKRTTVRHPPYWEAISDTKENTSTLFVMYERIL